MQGNLTMAAHHKIDPFFYTVKSNYGYGYLSGGDRISQKEAARPIGTVQKAGHSPLPKVQIFDFLHPYATIVLPLTFWISPEAAVGFSKPVCFPEHLSQKQIWEA